MASQSLYRKWRSQTFDEMVGQEEIRRTLRNALEHNQLRHAYLFTGPRGTGKTTTARLLAKTVNCLSPRDGEPCNECQQCREITAGTSFNVIEIDAASNRGIDSIRELREKVMLPPATGKYKIYILDEAHMLTTEAFNALLKTLEEPPNYAIFVMATTDVHKMLPTVISRCQRFDFKRFSSRQIVRHLLFVAKEEQVELEQGAAELIARAAAGGMRDALSLLDQAIAYAGNVISLAQVQAMLGVADPRAIAQCITHIARLESPALLHLIHELSEAGADLRQVNAQLIEYWRALLLARAGADVGTILDLTEDEVKEIEQLLPAFTLDELTECARIFAQNDLMQKNQATPQLGLELAALECLELHRRAHTAQQHETPMQQRETPPLSPIHTQAPSVRQTTSTPAINQRPALPPPSQREAQHSAPPEVNRTEKVTAGRGKPPLPEGSTHEAGAVTSSSSVALTLQQVKAGWDRVRMRTMQKENGKLLGTYVGMCDVVGVEAAGEQTLIIIRAVKPGHYAFIRDRDRPKDVEWALSLEFNVPCRLRILGPDQSYTAASSPQGSASYSMGSATVQPSAYLERSQEALPPTAPRLSVPPTVAPAAHVGNATKPAGSRSARELASSQEMGENKRRGLSKEEAKQKALQDPVVREAVRMFGVNTIDVQPK